MDIPVPRPLAEWQKTPEYTAWVWALVDVDVTRFEGKAGKIDIALPRLRLAKIDDYARAQGATRSGFRQRMVRQR